MNILKRKQNKKSDTKAKVRKKYTPRFYILVLSGGSSVIGLILFVLYFFSLNMAFGGPSVIMMIAGFLIFRYYWKKEANISVLKIKDDKPENITNSLNLYPDKVEFANVNEPKGFPMQCLNDKNHYFVNIWDGKSLVPFVLPDQQYCDPLVFAQRVLCLPAHRKIFERKPKLLQKLKTAMLVVAIGIVWLLILTTTSGG